MKYRKDALFAAAKVLEYLHEELDKLDPELVYTTGEIVCHPNVHTVIPDYVDFHWMQDMRIRRSSPGSQYHRKYAERSGKMQSGL